MFFFFLYWTIKSEVKQLKEEAPPNNHLPLCHRWRPLVLWLPVARGGASASVLGGVGVSVSGCNEICCLLLSVTYGACSLMPQKQHGQRLNQRTDAVHRRQTINAGVRYPPYFTERRSTAKKLPQLLPEAHRNASWTQTLHHCRPPRSPAHQARPYHLLSK